MKKEMCPQCVGGGKNEDHIHKAVTEYSRGYKPKSTAQPAGKTKTQTVVGAAFHEVFNNKPKTVKTSASAGMQRKQMVAIALSKARAAGARIPKPRGK